MVLIAKRRNYITIEAVTRTSDNQGGWTQTWATSTSEWARAVPLSQSRTLDQGGIKYKMAVEFTIRRGTVVTPANRIVWNSENYTIHSVVPSEKLNDQIITAYV
jgi:SPP1 family predicted phage head-tail adaptor